VSLRLTVSDVPRQLARFVIGDETSWVGALSLNELILTFFINWL